VVDQTRKLLLEIVSNPCRLVIANFLHSVYTQDPQADEGHFSLVAGYDPRAQRVLVLDPDLDDYQPYWVTEQVFLEGMATVDSSSGRARGYLSIRVPAKTGQ
jgi:Phytochelatin synthase